MRRRSCDTTPQRGVVASPIVSAELTVNVLSYDVACDEIFALRHRIVLLCDVVLAMRRRNAVLWPRPYTWQNAEAFFPTI